MRHNEEADNVIFLMVILVGLWAVFALTSCTPMPVQPEGAPAAQPAVQQPTAPSTACHSGAWCAHYDDLVSANLTPAMKSVPFGDLCPNGTNPLKFWPALFQATAEKESSFKWNEKYTESFPDAHGVKQVSQGLFQLSLDDAKRGVASCAGLSAVTILQPEPNILCSVGIMDQLIRANTKTGLRANLGRYWSTIRDAKVDARMKALVPDCFYIKKAVIEEMMDMP